MMLQDALISATEIFKEKVSAINFHQREKTKIYIESCVLEQFGLFSESLRNYANEEISRVEAMVTDNENWDQHMDEEQKLLVDYLLDKELAVQRLDQSKETSEKYLGDLEVQITKALRADWDLTITNLEKRQHARNRSIISEIVTTCETFNDQIKDQFKSFRGDEDD